MIKVILIDDHELVRTGIRHILESVADIEVVGEGETGEDALKLTKKYKPDVLLMDLNMPGIGGIEATRRLMQTKPGVQIIVLTVHAEKPYPTQLFKVGAMGYMTKGCSAKELLSAIRTVSKGERYLSTEVAKNLAMSLLPGAEDVPFDHLSHREMQVLLMIAEGENLANISDKLCISPKTVSTYRHRLFEKLDVSNDVELTHLAIKNGLLEDITV